ncbi:hypothetical protein [Chryseobacterium sp. MMS23-Vi53]|uniref:hypothetical protein n=1 Tax=Chryseobacterium sp. MMS23-Vi53 TaxID=3386644 RepID=UPI0039ECC8A8
MIFWILAFSCKAPVSSLYQDGISVISAEKTDWFGGRPGIRGTVYTIRLKLKDNKDLITIKSLKAEGNNISFTQARSGNTITVRGNLQSTPQLENYGDTTSGSSAENSKDSSKLNPKDNRIEYTTKDSKKTYKISIPEFVPVEPIGELIPQRQ